MRILGTIPVAPLPSIRKPSSYSPTWPSWARPDQFYRMVERSLLLYSSSDNWPRDIHTEHDSIREKRATPRHALTEALAPPPSSPQIHLLHQNLARGGLDSSFYGKPQSTREAPVELTVPELHASSVYYKWYSVTVFPSSMELFAMTERC